MIRLQSHLLLLLCLLRSILIQDLKIRKGFVVGRLEVVITLKSSSPDPQP